MRALDAGLAIDPNAAALLAQRSNAEDYLRRFEQSKSDIQQAMLLSPRDPAMSQWHNLRADPELGLGRFDEALEDVKEAVDGGYRNIYSYINLAAAHAFKGEMDEAKAAMAEARRLKPDLSVKWLMKHKPVLQFAFDGLRKAGVAGGMTAVRRLAAILAADVVGYSQADGRGRGGDGAGGAASIGRRRVRSSRASGGRIVKTTGDGVLLEFPSIVAAVECAIAIQKLMVERNAETPGD